jgi:hypothetical protein
MDIRIGNPETGSDWHTVLSSVLLPLLSMMMIMMMMMIFQIEVSIQVKNLEQQTDEMVALFQLFL